MWNPLKHQIRNYVNYKQKKKEKSRELPSLHIKRTRAELMIQEGLGRSVVSPARVILNDLTPKGIFLFTTNQLPIGQALSLTMEDPKRFYVRGHVISCQTVIMDRRVISEENYQYRVGIVFDFQSSEESDAVQAYCEELYAEIYPLAA
ncbi:MAG: hypothetical protein ACXWPM_09695 [Bdellovibrionota bacterium]